MLTSSQGLVFATAMAVSAGTLIVYDLFRDKYFSPSRNQDGPDEKKRILKSCLHSGDKKKEKEEKKKKKRVQFAADVKDTEGNGELYRKEHRKFSKFRKNSCKSEIVGRQEIPANRMALYSGILKDRVQRIEYSY